MIFLMAQDWGQEDGADVAGERALLYVVTPVRELAVFPELINCCLSFICFPLTLPPLQL